MALSKTALLVAKDSLVHLALVLAVVAAVPVLALAVLGVRLLIPVLLVVWAIALAVSPSFRRRLVDKLGGGQSW